jgi:hypothetical protein
MTPCGEIATPAAQSHAADISFFFPSFPRHPPSPSTLTPPTLSSLWLNSDNLERFLDFTRIIY